MISTIFHVFLGKIGGKILSSLNRDHIWNLRIDAILLDSQYDRGNEILFFDFPSIYKKIVSCVQTKNAVFIGDNGIVSLFISHGTGLALKTWKMLSTVQKMPKCSDQVRSSHARSGLAKQSYLDLKIHIQHSTCYTEATYQIPCQSGHTTQSNYKSPHDIKAFSQSICTSKLVSRKVLKCPPHFLAYSMVIF